MLKNKFIENNALTTLDGYQISIAPDRLTYTINNRKNGDLSRVHAYSPQVLGARLTGSAIFFVSCDFKGADMKYSENKFEALKAYLDTLGTEYRVVVCNTLPRHNWKHIVRGKDIDSARYDEILKECNNDGKQAAELFYQEGDKAAYRSSPLRDAEQAIENLAYKITHNANQHRVDQCKRIFSAQRIILWSDFYQNLPRLLVDYQEALKGCREAVIDGARNREGDLNDNILYKQEELIVDLHIAKLIDKKPVIAFYNEFSKQADQTGHMRACEAFGHLRVLDIFYEEETKITQTLLSAGVIIKKEMKTNDHEQQLAHCNRLYAKMRPSLQKEFVLELLEQSKMQVPSQYKFIDSCLQLYKTLSPSLQLKFIAALLEHPRKKIMAYNELINRIDSFYMGSFYAIGEEETVRLNQAHSTSNPLVLFGFQEKMQNHVRSACTKIHDRRLMPLASSSLMLTKLSSVNLNDDPKKSSTLLDMAIDAGVDLQAEDRFGFTPLLKSVIWRKMELSDALLKAGARFDDQTLSDVRIALKDFAITWADDQERVKTVKEVSSLVEQYHEKKPHSVKK
jgi:hypothetical protein